MPQQETNRRLADGTRLLVREIRPEDRALLALGFERFGPESRYQRFLCSKDELTESELRYLTELDGIDHFAIGALAFDARGVAQPVGIARCVRVEPGSEIAEPAVAVVDAMQGKGVGTMLLRELSDAAYARGVRRFRCSVLASNAPIASLVHELEPSARVLRSEAGVNDLEIDLPAPQAGDDGAARHHRLEDVLRLLAAKLVAWVPRKTAD